MSMNARERVFAVLEHRVPDRLPCFHWGYSPAPDYLRKHLSVDSLEDVVDISHIVSLKRPAQWKEKIEGGVRFNELGIGKRKVGAHDQLVVFPLAGLENPGEVDDFAWPDPHDKSRVSHLKGEIRRLEDKGLATILEASFGGGPGVFESAWMMMGCEKFLGDTIANPKLCERIMDKMLELNKVLCELALKEINGKVDMFYLSDDLADQRSLLISPDYYRKVVKPRQKALIDHIKRFTKARIVYHSCGAITGLLEDLIEIGVDVLNPIQPAALDLEFLKNKFGQSLVFFGGVDTQQVLPFGTPEEVRKEVKKIFNMLGEKGGFIMAPAHHLQAGVPDENIVAMYKAVSECKY